MVTSIRVLVANRPPFARAGPLVAPLPHLRPQFVVLASWEALGLGKFF